ELNINNLFHNKINNDEVELMIRDVTDEEIKEAMFDIGKNKALGPDGFTLTFFKSSWDIAGKDVCLAIHDLFNFGKLLGEVNATMVSLILKIPQPNKVSDFRPIACCNVLYKCISKILFNKIKGAFDKIVNLNQGAFIPGRIIQDNLMLSQELLKVYNCKNRPIICALKIDIAKAYDKVNWCFLEKILNNFRFHKKVKWIMTCVSSATFTIRVNGERHGYFRSSRGLRQGDPISPYLFTIVMDENSIKVIIKESLWEFSRESGLLPNMDKSIIFFRSVNEMMRHKISKVLPFKVGKLPVKYLGIPLLAKILGVKDCKCLVDKVKNKVQD
nr:hypothetical protein [Tanacetum cinerariifolium]